MHNTLRKKQQQKKKQEMMQTLSTVKVRQDQ